MVNLYLIFLHYYRKNLHLNTISYLNSEPHHYLLNLIQKKTTRVQRLYFPNDRNDLFSMFTK